MTRTDTISEVLYSHILHMEISDSSTIIGRQWQQSFLLCRLLFLLFLLLSISICLYNHLKYVCLCMWWLLKHLVKHNQFVSSLLKTAALTATHILAQIHTNKQTLTATENLTRCQTWHRFISKGKMLCAAKQGSGGS